MEINRHKISSMLCGTTYEIQSAISQWYIHSSLFLYFLLHLLPKSNSKFPAFWSNACKPCKFQTDQFFKEICLCLLPSWQKLMSGDHTRWNFVEDPRKRRLLL